MEGNYSFSIMGFHRFIALVYVMIVSLHSANNFHICFLSFRKVCKCGKPQYKASWTDQLKLVLVAVTTTHLLHALCRSLFLKILLQTLPTNLIYGVDSSNFIEITNPMNSNPRWWTMSSSVYYHSFQNRSPPAQGPVTTIFYVPYQVRL